MRPDSQRSSIRLFENDFLERLSHVHPVTPLLVWGPVALWLLWLGIDSGALSGADFALLGVAGLLTWSLTEYLLHRFLFHYEARSKAGRWLVFLFHGNHHDDPWDKTRLVMPPAGALPILVVLYLLFGLLLPEPALYPFFGCFMIGYLIYDYIHYGTHHFPMRNPVAKFIRRYHLKHHFSGDGGRFGVSSPLWDMLLGTLPEEKARDRP